VLPQLRIIQAGPDSLPCIRAHLLAAPPVTVMSYRVEKSDCGIFACPFPIAAIHRGTTGKQAHEVRQAHIRCRSQIANENVTMNYKVPESMGIYIHNIYILLL
jgi:hypothetical protein